jgi:phage shock protein C
MDEQVKRLYRSRTDRRIAGVCGGVAEYFKIDPTLVRLLFVAGLLLVGGTFWAYIIMMIVIPEEPL